MIIFHEEAPSSVRRFALALMVILTCLTVAGCAGNVADTPKRKVATAKPRAVVTVPPAMVGAPKVGDCWNTTPAVLRPLVWKGTAAVSCTRKHNAVTFLVGRLPGNLTYAKLEADGLNLVKAVSGSCNRKSSQAYLGAAPTALLSVRHAYFAPTKAQWAAGARWFRCDLGFEDKGWEDWGTLPVNIRASVSKDDRPYLYCSNSARVAGPMNEKDHTTSKCGTGSHWVVVRAVDLARSPGEAYPGVKQVRERGRKACISRLSPFDTSFLPSSVGWKAHDSSAWCWAWIDGSAGRV